MAALSDREPLNVAGYGVSLGSDVLNVQLFSDTGLTAGGLMSLKMAREFARTILQVAGEGASDGG